MSSLLIAMQELRAAEGEARKSHPNSQSFREIGTRQGTGLTVTNNVIINCEVKKQNTTYSHIRSYTKFLTKDPSLISFVSLSRSTTANAFTRLAYPMSALSVCSLGRTSHTPLRKRYSSSPVSPTGLLREQARHQSRIHEDDVYPQRLPAP